MFDMSLSECDKIGSDGEVEKRNAVVMIKAALRTGPRRDIGLPQDVYRVIRVINMNMNLGYPSEGHCASVFDSLYTPKIDFCSYAKRLFLTFGADVGTFRLGAVYAPLIRFHGTCFSVIYVSHCRDSD